MDPLTKALIVKVKGGSEPVVGNATPKARANNRRIEAILEKVAI